MMRCSIHASCIPTVGVVIIQGRWKPSPEKNRERGEEECLGHPGARVRHERRRGALRTNPHFSPSPCCGTVGRALDCVRAGDPILNAEAELAQAEADRREGHTIPTASRRWSDHRLCLARPRPTAPQGGVWREMRPTSGLPPRSPSTAPHPRVPGACTSCRSHSA